MVITVISVLAALVIILAAVAGYLLWRAQAAAASEVTLEPTNSATTNSFMPPQGPDASVAAPPTRTGGAVTGSTPGLFGGTQNNGSCDQDQMAQFLHAHQDKAAAWAEAEGIQADNIPTFVHQLTPVLLRADTYITNHGYRDGELTSYPAVLQAGTAVLVDGYGTPRVKCYCGNPVSAPPYHQPTHFQGRTWTRFAPVTIVVVQPAPVVVRNLTIINIQNNVVYNVVLPPWQWGPPPGWTWTPSTSTSSTSSDSAQTSSGPDGQQPMGPGTGCGPLDGAPGDADGSTTTCNSTSTTSPTTTSPTTTSPTTTSPTTTSSATTSSTTTTPTTTTTMTTTTTPSEAPGTAY